METTKTLTRVVFSEDVADEVILVLVLRGLLLLLLLKLRVVKIVIIHKVVAIYI